MAHATARGAYGALTQRLNRMPQGAPPSDLLYRILALLFTEKEAGLVARLPVRPVTAKRAASLWNMRESGGPRRPRRPCLEGRPARHGGPEGDSLHAPAADGRLLRVLDDAGARRHRPAPPRRAVLPVHHRRGRLHHRPVHERRDPAGPGVRERALAAAPENRMEVLDYERASEVIDTAQHMGVGLCYCRHKAGHLGKACKAPMSICMTFGGTADSLIRHGHARRGGAGRGARPARAGVREQPRPVRRERPA